MQIAVWIFAERRRVSQHVGREVVAIGSRVTDVQGRNSHIVLSLEDLHDLPEHQRNALKTGKGEDDAHIQNQHSPLSWRKLGCM